MLESIAATSEKISVENSDEVSDYPRFALKKDGEFTGVFFTGIPGSHEFTSLVLAILNDYSKGKLPDADTQKCISRLKGPIRLRTFVSLSCENCPDVIQALNAIAKSK